MHVAEQLQDPRFNYALELPLCSFTDPFVSTWVSFSVSDFLPPPEKHANVQTHYTSLVLNVNACVHKQALNAQCITVSCLVFLFSDPEQDKTIYTQPWKTNKNHI